MLGDVVQAEDWNKALQYLTDGSTHEIKVHTVNKGGMKGMLAGIEGFLPYSKVYKLRDDTNIHKHYGTLLASSDPLKLKVKVVAVSPRKPYVASPCVNSIC